MIRVPIFMYHHVSDLIGLASKNIQVSPEEFEKQMRFLYQKGFHCLSLAEVVSNWQHAEPQPGRSFVLTFDDGYVDNYKNVLPILEKFGFTATIFVVVKPVEEGNKRYLSWPEIRELALNQFTIGSHTSTHPRLINLDHKTIERELDESKKIIEDRLGLRADLLAYPYGESNERIQEAACKSGYQAACGVNSGNFSRFNLWRVPVKEQTSELTFCLKAYGGYFIYTWFREQTIIGRKMLEIHRKLLD